MLRPIVWLWNGSSYVDLTSYVASNSVFNWLSSATDEIFVGLDYRSIGLYVDVSTAGSYTGLTNKYSSDGSTWNNFNIITAYNFDTSKYSRWVLPNSWSKFAFTGSVPYSATPPDTTSRYWLKFGCSTAPTTAVVSKIRCIPYILYANPTKVYQELQLKSDFSSTSSPTNLVIEDMIRRAEDRIDYRTRKSWRFNAVTEETDPKLIDFNRYGMYLRHRNFMKVYSVQMWNGAAFDTLTEGRSNDYFVDYDRGMIIMTRMFLLPAIYGMMGRYAQYTFGEFKQAIKVDYAYGRNWETDPEFYMVEDIATKMAAIDVLRHHDYSSLVSSGVDKVSLDSKIINLEQQVETRLDEISAVAIF